MSWADGLLVGLGTGLQRAVPTYLEERNRRQQAAREEEDSADRRLSTVDRMMRERDELEERKRSNRKQEELEHDRNVQSSLDRMVSRENARYGYDEATRRAVETALIRADALKAHEAAVSERASKPRVRQPTTANPDGLTQTQRDGLMLINRDWLPGEQEQKHEMERLYRQAREAFPEAHPGDVAMAAKRLYDRTARDRANAKANKYR